MVKPYANESSKCALLLDICNDNLLDQMNNEPTRISGATKNILDLVLTSHSNFIENCRVSGGLISDHLMVCFSLNFKPKFCKKQPRKIFLYGKGDITSLRSDLNAFKAFFSANPDQHTVQETQCGEGSKPHPCPTLLTKAPFLSTKSRTPPF